MDLWVLYVLASKLYQGWLVLTSQPGPPLQTWGVPQLCISIFCCFTWELYTSYLIWFKMFYNLKYFILKIYFQESHRGSSYSYSPVIFLVFVSKTPICQPKKYVRCRVGAHLSMGNLFQDPRWVPKIMDSIKPYIHCPFSYIYKPVIKFNL